MKGIRTPRKGHAPSSVVIQRDKSLAIGSGSYYGAGCTKMSIFIHVIKRKGKHEYRCGNNTSDSYYLSSVEEPFSDLEEAVEHMVKWELDNEYDVFEDLSHPKATNHAQTPDQAKETWTSSVLAIRREKDEFKYYDLDSYKRTVRKITGTDTAQRLGLSERQITNLRKSVDFVLNHPGKKSRFGFVTLENTIESISLHPIGLTKEDLHALDQGFNYVLNLKRTYE